MPDDFYDLLGVPPDAPPEDIRAAYRSKAREFHPDRNDDERAGPQFKAVRRAYDVLTDEEERAAYDRMGHESYVAKRMGGLPTHGMGGEAGSAADAGGTRSRSRGRQRTAGSRSDRSAGESRSDDRDDRRYGDGEAFATRRRQQRASRRRRRLAADGSAGLGMLVYLLGLGAFLRAHAATLRAGGAADPLSFVRGAPLGPVLAAGVALFAAGVGAAALRTDRRRGALVATAALGPALGVGLAAAGAGTRPVLAATLAAAPACALAGLAVLVARR